MASPTEWKDWIQFGVVIPIAYLWQMVYTYRRDYNQFRQDVYTKDETEKLIDLKNAPLTQKLDTMQDDIRFIRAALERRRREDIE